MNDVVNPCWFPCTAYSPGCSPSALAPGGLKPLISSPNGAIHTNAAAAAVVLSAARHACRSALRSAAGLHRSSASYSLIAPLIGFTQEHDGP